MGGLGWGKILGLKRGVVGNSWAKGRGWGRGWGMARTPH